jgi:hypothetical protein
MVFGPKALRMYRYAIGSPHPAHVRVPGMIYSCSGRSIIAVDMSVSLPIHIYGLLLVQVKQIMPAKSLLKIQK